MSALWTETQVTQVPPNWLQPGTELPPPVPVFPRFKEKRVFVTSWSNKGYEQYGKKFLESWQEFGWRDAAPLVVFHEGKVPEAVGPVYLDLLGDPDVVAFHKTYGRFPEANGVGKTKDGRLVVDYRWQATKFARKVFAITSSGRIPQANWRIWIDADVVFKRRPELEFWEQVTPDDKDLVYIGRDNRDWHHSECGWVSYKLPQCLAFLKTFRDVYSTGKVFKLGEWHDSFVFDWCRQKYDQPLAYKNLAEGIRGMHPWPETILGRYMDHYKGPVAKKEFYG
jgi:hypothetical protein